MKLDAVPITIFHEKIVPEGSKQWPYAPLPDSSVLTERKFTPPGLVFLVSSVMLEHIDVTAPACRVIPLR